MTVLVVVFVEVLPKTLAIVRADDVARALSGPMLLVVRLLGPVIYAIQWIVRHTLRLFGVRLDMGTDVLAAHEEIRGAVEYHHSEGAVESRDRRMLGGVLDLGELTVADVMVHRRQIAMLDADRPAARDRRRGAEEPLHAPAALSRRAGERGRACCTPRTSPAPSPRSTASTRSTSPPSSAEPWFMPETTHLKDQLNAFLKRRAHFALVVDEYGALQGLVTLEDILEEIVGEIEDEHDTAIERRAAASRRLGDRRRRRQRARAEPGAGLGPAGRARGLGGRPGHPRGADHPRASARPSSSTTTASRCCAASATRSPRCGYPHCRARRDRDGRASRIGDGFAVA